MIIICALFLPSIKTKVWGCLLPFESFGFQDAIMTIEWQSRTFKQYLFLFQSSNGLEWFKMEPADINNDTLVGAACVPHLNGILFQIEIITHGYHHIAIL